MCLSLTTMFQNDRGVCVCVWGGGGGGGVSNITNRKLLHHDEQYFMSSINGTPLQILNMVNTFKMHLFYIYFTFR